jgi:hypothetical protein
MLKQALHKLLASAPEPFDIQAVAAKLAEMEANGNADLKAALASFAPILGDPGNALVMMHSVKGHPFVGRVMSTDCRTARLAVGLCYHPGLGHCLATVRSFGATWHSAHPDDIRGNSDGEGRFVLNPASCVFFGPEDMSTSTAISYLVRLADAVATGRYALQRPWETPV